jgi:hypothetical protein
MRQLALLLTALLAWTCRGHSFLKPAFVTLRGGSSNTTIDTTPPTQYGRISDDLFRLTPDQIEAFHREGCVTIENVLTEEEVEEIQTIFDRFTAGEIPVPGKDFCDMSKP